MPATTAAVVGAAGGVGTTRTVLETAAVLAADGRDVTVLDAAYGTQGLARRLAGRLDPDVTAMVTGDSDASLAAATRDLDWGTPGTVACLPVSAPFERLARAKTPEAAEAFAALVDDAASEADHVLVDTPPVAANQAVAAVTAADRVAVVARATERGVDAAQETRGRLRDVGTEADAVVAVESADGEGVDDADAVVPRVAGEAPTALDDDGMGSAVVGVAAATLDVDLDVDFEKEGLVERLRSR